MSVGSQAVVHIFPYLSPFFQQTQGRSIPALTALAKGCMNQDTEMILMPSHVILLTMAVDLNP